jgi:pimeloyl-ACP methyl ester carboxylesterase
LSDTRAAEGSCGEFEVRVHEAIARPAQTLIYLPGLHGNWTLIGNFRRALSGRVRFVETCYPPTLEWSLDDFAQGFERALAATGIRSGWLLAESFGSQVAWPILQRSEFKVEGLILAGGFVKHPLQRTVRIAESIAGRISLTFLTYILFGYARLSRFRFRNSPDTLRGIEEFIARLTERERQAAKHRLHLVADHAPLDIARHVRVPVFALTGLFDPVVPWVFVRLWLKRHCRALREYRILWRADHNVLGTAPQRAADLVIQWMQKEPSVQQIDPRPGSQTETGLR